MECDKFSKLTSHARWWFQSSWAAPCPQTLLHRALPEGSAWHRGLEKEDQGNILRQVKVAQETSFSSDWLRRNRCSPHMLLDWSEKFIFCQQEYFDIHVSLWEIIVTNQAEEKVDIKATVPPHSKTYLYQQWATESTHWLLMSTPPQKWYP